jgi:hypothetical protein
MLTIASLALAVICGGALPARQSARPLVSEGSSEPKTVLAELDGLRFAPSSLRERIDAVRAQFAPPAATLAELQREEQLRRSMLPEAKDSLGSVSRGVYLGRSGAADRNDVRLGSKGRREALSRPPPPKVRRRGR